MHIFFRSRRSQSQEPLQADPRNGLGVNVPKPKSSHRVREFLSLGRSHKQKVLQANSSNAIGAPSSTLEPDTSRQAADSHAGQHQDLLHMAQPPSIVASQLSVHSQIPTIPLRQHSPLPLDGHSYQLHAGQDIHMIHESKNITLDGNHNNVHYTSNFVSNPNKFMVELLEKTIQGAAFDSSDRDPPPRCHPGTRLAVIARCLEFIANAAGKKKLRWVFGAAGVGKSAIMQSIAESPLPSVSERASIFLSINGRNDGAKIVMTLVYQLATQCEPYRQFVEHEITRHPALLRSSMSVQFKKFLVEPLIDTRLSNSVGHILIIIDGLDECDKPEAQRELLRLITETCSAHPSSPFVWIIASRPEHHIRSFFAQDGVQTIYEKEEIEVDSDEARSDVERFLRAELARIQKEFSVSSGSQWPREQDFWKLANASGGLFVYAQTVTKYIGSLAIADPVSQLDDVLKVIDAHPLRDVPREQHPLVLLDALYARILSKVPHRIMVNTRKILLALVLDLRNDWEHRKEGFSVLCNWLGMTCDEAYTAIRHLGSVLDAPPRDEAHEKKLRPFHKSFIDYVSDFTRSGFSSDIEHEARQLDVQYATRILGQAPGGIDCRDLGDDVYLSSGYICAGVAGVPGAGSNVVLTWPAGKDSNWSDEQVRWEVYKWAFANAVEGIGTRQSVFCTEFYIRMVVTQIVDCQSGYFPYRALIDFVFEESRRHEFIKSGMLKTVPIMELDFTMTWSTKLRFRRASGTTTSQSDPWRPSCRHERAGNWGEDEDEDWTTEFNMDPQECHFCCQRLKQQLESFKAQSPDHVVTILLTSAEESFVEFHFADPDDGISKWTYWVVLEIPEEMRRKPGSIV